MKVTANLLDIIEEIKRKNAHFIVVDGVDGSGKSTLANEISENLGYVHINLDDYLEKNRGYFVKYIKYDPLKKAIDDERSSIIIEGVCILAVLKNLKIMHDFLIYIKRISRLGFWNDDYLYEVDGDIDAFIARQNLEYKEICEKWAQIEGKDFDPNDPKNSTIPKLTEELIRYHYEFKPQEIADIIYERIN